jgi:hypothetical protein
MADKDWNELTPAQQEYELKRVANYEAKQKIAAEKKAIKDAEREKLKAERLAQAPAKSAERAAKAAAKRKEKAKTPEAKAEQKKAMDAANRNIFRNSKLISEAKAAEALNRKHEYNERQLAIKEKKAERRQAYLEKNRDAILEKQRAYYKKNRDAILEYHRAYREKNRDAILEKRRANREKNRKRS